MLLASVALSLALSPSASRTERLTLATGDATITVREPTHEGIPVRGAYEVVVTPQGRAASTTAQRGPEGAVYPGSSPVLTPDDAVRTAQVLGWYPRSQPTLVYVLVLGRAVLAHELALPLTMRPQPAQRTLWLSARTGSVLRMADAAFHSRARVFPEDPSTTPTPIEVTLTTLEASGAGLPMRSDAFDVRGCADTPDGDVPAWWQPPSCAPVSRALSNPEGDYFLELPDIALVHDGRAFDDAYAEVAAYRAVENFFTVMNERGLASRRCERFTVVVNHYTVDDEGERVPNDGASFIDNCDAQATAQLIVGQGREADYAYDADVLYHELGHSVVQQLSPAGLSERSFAAIGVISESGAINEGLADYFAMTISDNADVGEYVGRFGVAGGTPYISTGANAAVCPDDLIGEWHSDGRIVSAALWAMRSRLGPVVDELVFRALPRLAPDSVLDDFGVALLAVAQELASEGTLDAFGLALTQRSLASRGLLDCDHVIDDPLLATRGKRMHLVAANEAIVPFAPGPLQLRYEVPPDAGEVTLFFSTGASDAEPVSASFLVKRGDEAIEFAYALREADGAEAIEVTGDYDVDLPAEALNGEDFIARLEVTPGEVLHIALANRTPAATAVGNFFVVASQPSQVRLEDEDGCACGVPHDRDPRAAWILGVLLLGSIHRRGPLRRRAGTPSRCG